MVTGDDKGTIILWDLENRRIVYRMEAAFGGRVDGVFFWGGELVGGVSGIENSVKQFRINVDDTKTLQVYR
jgi:hypothetical protein